MFVQGRWDRKNSAVWIRMLVLISRLQRQRSQACAIHHKLEYMRVKAQCFNT